MSDKSEGNYDLQWQKMSAYFDRGRERYRERYAVYRVGWMHIQ